MQTSSLVSNPCGMPACLPHLFSSSPLDSSSLYSLCFFLRLLLPHCRRGTHTHVIDARHQGSGRVAQRPARALARYERASDGGGCARALVLAAAVGQHRGAIGQPLGRTDAHLPAILDLLSLRRPVRLDDGLQE